MNNKKVECPICGEETDISITRKETFHGMLEDLDGYSFGQFKCPICGLTYNTDLYPEKAPENLMIEDVKKKLDFLTGEIDQDYGNDTDRVIGVLLRLKIAKEKGIEHVSIHDATDYLGPIP